MVSGETLASGLMEKIGTMGFKEPVDSFKEWMPQAPSTEGGPKWRPLVRVGRVVPWGYMQDPDDPDILLPIDKELDLLEEAKIHLKKYGYRAVANWLSEQSGRYISHIGLMKRVKIERKRHRQATSTRFLIKRLEEAIKKAETLDRKYVGGGRPEGASDTETGTD